MHLQKPFSIHLKKHVQFVYLRELDLEKINRATVEKLSRHPRLKKLIVHGCRNFDALQDFSNLPQLLVVKGEIMGLKVVKVQTAWKHSVAKAIKELPPF